MLQILFEVSVHLFLIETSLKQKPGHRMKKGHIGRVRDHQGVQGERREGHVLQTLCFKVILRHLKKPQDEARNFEEDSMRAQVVLWEGHVLE